MKFSKILSYVAAGLVLVGANACTDEIKPTPSPTYEGNEVYFNVDEIGVLDIESESTHVNVNVYRVDASSEITVAIESSVTDQDGNDISNIFTVPSQVTFPAGETMVQMPVSYDFANIESEYEYNLYLKIAGETTTPYGATEGDFTIVYGTKWEEWSEYLENEYAYMTFGFLWGPFEYESTVMTRKSTNNPNLVQYLFEDPFSDVDFDILATVHLDVMYTEEDGDHYLVSLSTIAIPEVSWQDSYPLMKDAATIYVGENVVTQRNLERVRELLAEVNQEIPNFCPQTGFFYISTGCQTPEMEEAGRLYFTDPVTAQLPGFKVYQLAVYDGGVVKDATGAEKKVIEVYKSEDVYGVKANVHAGTLTDEEVEAAAQALAEDATAEISTEAISHFNFALEDGEYTVVAIGLNDNEEMVISKSFTFTYQSSEVSDYQTIGFAQYTDGFLNSLIEDAPTTTWDVEVQQHKTNPGLYRLKNPYRTWAEMNEVPEMIMEGNYYLYINAETSNLVYIEPSNLGLRNDPFEGAVWASSKAYTMLNEGVSPAAIRLRGANGTLTNNVITFKINQLLVTYESLKPEYSDANTSNSFKLDLGTLHDAKPAPVNGRTMTAAERRAAMNDNMIHRMNIR